MQLLAIINGKVFTTTKNGLHKNSLFGPESTGKTSLAVELSKYYKTLFVKEFAREFLQKKMDKKIRSVKLMI